jgi:hypothetical protein
VGKYDINPVNYRSGEESIGDKGRREPYVVCLKGYTLHIKTYSVGSNHLHPSHPMADKGSRTKDEGTKGREMGF